MRWCFLFLALTACGTPEPAASPEPGPVASPDPTPSCSPGVPSTSRPRAVAISAAWWGAGGQTRTVLSLDRHGRRYDAQIEQLQAPPQLTRTWEAELPLDAVDPLRALLDGVACGEAKARPPRPDDTARRRIELRYIDPATTVVLSSESPGDGAPWAVSARRGPDVIEGVRADAAAGDAVTALIQGLEASAPPWPGTGPKTD